MWSLLFAKRYERRSIVSTISMAYRFTFAYQIDSSSILQMYLRVYVYIYVYDTIEIGSFKTTNSTSKRLKTTKPMTFSFLLNTFLLTLTTSLFTLSPSLSHTHTLINSRVHGLQHREKNKSNNIYFFKKQHNNKIIK